MYFINIVKTLMQFEHSPAFVFVPFKIRTNVKSNLFHTHHLCLPECFPKERRNVVVSGNGSLRGLYVTCYMLYVSRAVTI